MSLKTSARICCIREAAGTVYSVKTIRLFNAVVRSMNILGLQGCVQPHLWLTYTAVVMKICWKVSNHRFLCQNKSFYNGFYKIENTNLKWIETHAVTIFESFELSLYSCNKKTNDWTPLLSSSFLDTDVRSHDFTHLSTFAKPITFM